MSLKDLHLLTRGNIWSLEKPVGTPLREFSSAECLKLLESSSTSFSTHVYHTYPTFDEPISPKESERTNTKLAQENRSFSFKNSAPYRGRYGGDIPENSRFFVIKLYNFEQASKAYRSNSWSSTPKGNRKLTCAYNTLGPAGRLFLFMSINGSGKFCAVAEVLSLKVRNSDCDDRSYGHWVDEQVKKHRQRQKPKQKGKETRKQERTEFQLRWWYITDVENKRLKHLCVPSNGNKPVTTSRDTQELPLCIGKAMLDVFQEK